MERLEFQPGEVVIDYTILIEKVETLFEAAIAHHP